MWLARCCAVSVLSSNHYSFTSKAHWNSTAVVLEPGSGLSIPPLFLDLSAWTISLSSMCLEEGANAVILRQFNYWHKLLARPSRFSQVAGMHPGVNELRKCSWVHVGPQQKLWCSPLQPISSEVRGCLPQIRKHLRMSFTQADFPADWAVLFH